MKRVKDFNEGEHINTKLLISSLVKGVTNSGAPYLSLVLQDSSKSIEAKLWDVKAEIEKEISVGKIMEFELEINRYRGNLQAKVIRVFPVNQSEIDFTDYVFNSPIDRDELRKGIYDTVNQLNNETISKIVNAMLNYYDNDFYDYPAASRIHHNYIGGLATHTYGMVRLANAICDLYPSINRDLLLAGVIIHDLGKIEEFTSPVITEYSTSGKLLGHISIVDARLLQIGNELKLQDSEELLLLRHMALSHHGQYEYGSPIRPEILEAEVLSFIDNLDSKINVIDKALEDIRPGEFTQKIFSLENRIFYKHK